MMNHRWNGRWNGSASAEKDRSYPTGSIQAIRSYDLLSLLISVYVSLLIAMGFLATNSALWHWSLIPIIFCGIIILPDAVDWMRGKVDPFDLAGILGLLGMHYFFLAPLLHIKWDLWMGEVQPPEDWRTWVGYLSIFNLMGIIAYRWARSLTWKRSGSKRHVQAWKLQLGQLLPIWITLLVLTCGLQMIVYSRFGGIMGYIQSYASNDDAFTGMGIIFMFSESFPILLMMGGALWYRSQSDKVPSWGKLMLVLAGFLMLQLLFGGLRGSRSNTLWSLFWAVGILHLYIRPITKKVILVGLCFVIAFMYLYGFYKDKGIDGITDMLQGKTQQASSTNDRSSLKMTLLGDLARTDIQSYVLYRLLQHGDDYDYALGETYLGAASLLIPSFLWSDKPPTKEKAGTEVLFGAGTYAGEQFQSSRVYGLLGESALNFGLIAIPAAFTVWGFVVGAIRRLLQRWRDRDIRILLLPLLINFCFVMLVGDSDNLVFFIVKSGFMPFLFLWLVSRRARSEE
ncbi:hypothetical protein [Paenibacillus marinisediminis]